MSRVRFSGAAVLAATMLVGISAQAASVVNIVGDSSNSTEGLGDFSGSISYEADLFSTVGTLVISLTNTSDASNGGYITGFLFNIGGSDTNANATLNNAVAQSHPFETCTGRGLSGQPYGSPFDAGAALNGSFLGGGSPLNGIGVGETGTFTFQVNAADAGSLTAMSFLTGGDYEFNFLVRFKGFLDRGSDKVPASVIVVPFPAGLSIGAVGLVAAIIGTRRYRRKLLAA